METRKTNDERLLEGSPFSKGGCFFMILKKTRTLKGKVLKEGGCSKSPHDQPCFVHHVTNQTNLSFKNLMTFH